MTKDQSQQQRLTGKQAAFVHAYLGEARFNATEAAKLAGYKATSKHAFQAIGSENLQRPGIRAAIDDYWRMSRMSADEILDELSDLARSDSSEKHLINAKVRALALLSAHHGLLDGSGARGNGRRDPVQVRVVYDDNGQELATSLPDDVLEAICKVYDDKDGKLSNAVYNQRVADALKQTYKELNEKDELFTQITKKRNALYVTKVDELCERYKNSPEVVKALKSTVEIVGLVFSSWNPLHVPPAIDVEMQSQQPEVEAGGS